MKIMLMDATKLVNLILPKEVFGNYWVVNAEKQNLVSVEAIDNNWILKSNSEVKVFRNGTAVEEALLEEEKFYTLKNILLGDSYVIYTCPVYDANALQMAFAALDIADFADVRFSLFPSAMETKIKFPLFVYTIAASKISPSVSKPILAYFVPAGSDAVILFRTVLARILEYISL